ncbi:MAG TPA: type II secretion system F family protein, partial [Verrucomicrobiota bacterium]|nr:type II secretion system F family protein [Verrucomicrobiota bacterium]
MKAFIFTPGQLARRADFYYQLGQLTGAGLGLVQALEQVRRNPPANSYRAPLGRVLVQLAAGRTFSEALWQGGPWLPEFDLALLRAGEHSGRLEACFRLLADYYTDRAQLARQMISNLVYPAFLLHFAVFIFPLATLLLSGDWVAYLGQTLGMLAPLYAGVGLGIFAAQSQHGEWWRAVWEALLHPLPVLGPGRRCL